MTIESIVRPFVARGVTPPQMIPPGSSSQQNIVVLYFGRVGKGKLFRCNTNGSVSSYMDSRHKEMGNLGTGGTFGNFG